MTLVDAPARPDLSPKKPNRNRPSLRFRKENRVAYLFLVPWLVGLALFVLGPMAASFYLSMTDYNFLQAPKFIALDNYVRMFTQDPRYLISARVTATYVLVSVPLQLGFALMLALLLNRAIRGSALYRGIFYLPSLLGTSVAVAILWQQVFGQEGLLNTFLGFLGVDAHTSWVGNPDTALSTLVILNAWTFGSPMIIFLAGLRQVPMSLYEAADVDGAGPLRKFLSITLPLLSPIIFFNLILQTIHAFQAFVPAYIISGGLGGPADSTLFYTLYLYQEGFGSFDMGYACAMAWTLLVAVGAVTALNFFISKYWVFYGDNS
ncbi:carbohydrate ABC transporter permease [Pseudarthrobacter sp. NamB4]|uniref:carbohydrate ABC transporter permease n=1 Tax=Pseudarthrobacter sp. NamB4 TaxID=2576837 RepID=UPI0010FEC997|nr:sugar ABC transporter permease [Pseudarthrobacter sp. NamB4]TLM70528.1 sugar ABC transporter permease [Pseudarthrobacter sp. NamB4]